jgi:8-oxo-dGTP pyrophosphatase MutT (NUDIX family)
VDFVPRRSEPFRPDAPIAAELAAGAVLVHETEGDLLLLHQQDEDRWCFPKGHVDPGESLAEAAMREIREETGLTTIRLEGELDEVSYRFFDPKKGRNVHKTTVYFLARTPDRNPRLESIFDRFEWVSLSVARARVPFDTDRRVLDALAHRPGFAPSR